MSLRPTALISAPARNSTSAMVREYPFAIREGGLSIGSMTGKESKPATRLALERTVAQAEVLSPIPIA